MTPRKRTYIDFALDRFEEHVERYDRRYRSKNRLPKNHVWRPYRFCVRDVVLGLTVVRHHRKDNLLEADLFLTTDLPQFEPHVGAKITTLFLLSEAFKCGGTMEIRFTETVWHGRVPEQLYDLAFDKGVDLNHVFEGHITPSESRNLYLALTDFSKEAEAKVRWLAKEDRISSERVCFMVHNGVWSLEEIESIILGSDRPERILLGKSVPEHRRLYLNDLIHARVALLGSFLDRKLAFRERGNEEKAFDLEADERRFNTSFDPQFFAKVCQPEEPIPIPWTNGSGDENWVFEGEQLVVMVRPRTSAELLLHFQEDLERAGEMRETYGIEESNHFFILTPRDFMDLPEERRKDFLEEARKKKVEVMVCPETVDGLDADAMDRLNRSRVIRQ